MYFVYFWNLQSIFTSKWPLSWGLWPTTSNVSAKVSDYNFCICIFIYIYIVIIKPKENIYFCKYIYIYTCIYVWAMVKTWCVCTNTSFMGNENPPHESMETIATDSLASNRFDALSAIRASWGTKGPRATFFLSPQTICLCHGAGNCTLYHMSGDQN